MAIYSVTMVSWKETAFPFCRATERHWKKNVVSRVSSTTVVIRLPISCVSSGHLMPCTSCLYGKWEEDVCAGQCGVFVYLILLLLLLLLLQYTRSGTVYAYSRSSAAVVSSTAATSGVGPRVTSLRGQSARRR